MKLRSLAFAPLLAAAALSLDCGGETVDLGGPVAPGSGDADDDDPGFPLATTASKVDVLIAVDDSRGMKDKSELLARSLRPLLERVTATGDVHLGVITSSLGTMGGDACRDESPQNRRAHLQTTGPLGEVVTPSGVLVAGPSLDGEAFIAQAEALVRGVREQGCGLEAQLESIYRFLVQPDPWDRVTVDAFNQATLGEGVDIDLLRQRADFLRPDSLLIVVLITDEDDSSADPRSIGGQGWGFASRKFPGSRITRPDQTTTAPRGTGACIVDPGSPDCTSCAFGEVCDPSTPTCQQIRNDPTCQTSGGYYAANEDSLDVRFHRMKERYGVDPQFPLERYVSGLSRAKVPDRRAEHVETMRSDGRREIATYAHERKCTNPIFASQLPRETGDELCLLPRSVRSPELVVFGVLGGVPRHLVAPEAAAPEATGDAFWTPIVGRDPERFDLSGIAPHMIASVHPRPGLPSPSTTPGDNGTDPVHGREWFTNGEGLQYACTYELLEPRDCATELGDASSCECVPGSTVHPPLCDAAGAQVRGKANPSLRPLRVARELGARAVIGSVCPASFAEGYRSFMQRLVARIEPRLAK